MPRVHPLCVAAPRAGPGQAARSCWALPAALARVPWGRPCPALAAAAGRLQPRARSPAGTMAHCSASAPENPPAPLGLGSRRLWLTLPLALEGQVMESPSARTPRAGNSPGLLGRALGRQRELQGAQPCVPSSQNLPCPRSPCGPVREQEPQGCSPCFWRALCLPTMGAGISVSSWSLARQHWERQVLFHGKVLQEEIPLWPGQPHRSPGPWGSIVSPVL